jgi:hypothetical protein
MRAVGEGQPTGILGGRFKRQAEAQELVAAERLHADEVAG